MNDPALEDRVRAATRALGGSWPDSEIPPLRLPEPRRSTWWARRFAWRAHWNRWLAPIAAAAVVVAIIVAVTAVGSPEPHGPKSTSPVYSPLKAGPPAAWYVASGAVPPYFVEITAPGNPNSVPSYAVVRATASGTLLTTVRPARGNTIVAATAAGDDRTFVLDEQKWVNDSATQETQVRVFYLLRLTSRGTVLSLTRLPITASHAVTGVALSLDGTRLAIAVIPRAESSLIEIRVYTLATGAVRIWSASGTIGSGGDDAESLSWTAGGRLLFEWQDAHTAGTRMLDLARPGTSLLAHSRWITAIRVTAPITASTLSCQDEIVTPDGTGVMCVASAASGRDTLVAIDTYSTATGKLTVSGRWKISNGGTMANVRWTNQSGSVIIGVLPTSGDGTVGIISDGKFTPLRVPDPANSLYAGVW